MFRGLDDLIPVQHIMCNVLAATNTGEHIYAVADIERYASALTNGFTVYLSRHSGSDDVKDAWMHLMQFLLEQFTISAREVTVIMSIRSTKHVNRWRHWIEVNDASIVLVAERIRKGVMTSDKAYA
jgi:hypothetical protein